MIKYGIEKVTDHYVTPVLFDTKEEAQAAAEEQRKTLEDGEALALFYADCRETSDGKIVIPPMKRFLERYTKS